MQRLLWESGRKTTSEYSENDWKNNGVKGIVKKWTDHPMAATFAAPKADPQVASIVC